MERSAVYRRALAPVMTANGLLGTLAAAVGILASIQSPARLCRVLDERRPGRRRRFVFAGAAGSLSKRPSGSGRRPPAGWRKPCSRPCFSALSWASFCWSQTVSRNPHARPWEAASLFGCPGGIALYGCALHAAGFFMPRGMKVFGWALVLGSSAFL